MMSTVRFLRGYIMHSHFGLEALFNYTHNVFLNYLFDYFQGHHMKFQAISNYAFILSFLQFF